MQTAFLPILNFAKFQCLLPIKAIRANGKCKKCSVTARFFGAVFVASSTYVTYLIFRDLFFVTELPFFSDAVFTCIYFSHLQTIFSTCCTSHSFIRNGCKWLSRVLGAFVYCKLQTTSKINFVKKYLRMQRIKTCYGVCSTIGLMYLLSGKGNKLTWQFQVLKCIYQLQIYTYEQIITTLNDYFYQSFVEIRINIFRKEDFHRSNTKVGINHIM